MILNNIILQNNNIKMLVMQLTNNNIFNLPQYIEQIYSLYYDQYIFIKSISYLYIYSILHNLQSLYIDLNTYKNIKDYAKLYPNIKIYKYEDYDDIYLKSIEKYSL